MKLCRLLLRVSLMLGAICLAGEVLAEDLYLEEPVSSGVFCADDTIIAQNNCLIEAGHNVLLLAGQEVVLKAGFHATEGSEFKATIGGYGDIPEDSDVDSDALADWWEVKYFSDTLSYSSGSDADGDGVVNSVEYRLGTNPAIEDLPGTGIHYEYDALGRLIKISRIPAQ
jgi:hypothetical protein